MFSPCAIRLGIRAFVLLILLSWSELVAGETFRVATYNVETYLDQPTHTRHVKSAESKAQIRKGILALKPDVLALQEMGTLSALQELRASLKSEGLDFPFWEYVTGYDTNIHLAILSRFPFTALRPHTNDSFLLSGRKYHVSRGFAEADIQVNSNYSFTLINAHLKSKRPVPQADENELRQEEAKVLREKIEERFAANPNVNLVVVGDLNDNQAAASTKTVIGRGKHKLVDTCPAERSVDKLEQASRASAAPEARRVTWTQHYALEDSFGRFDYLLLSPGMAREWVRNETFVLSIPNWGLGSDHRPLVASFEASDRQ
jgi:endonuclease/exonuclease/phosphatase family metal-dependent hydrolase